MVLFERHPLEPTVRWHTVANELSMTFVLDQILDGLVVIDAQDLDEASKAATVLVSAITECGRAKVA
jgi:hypothetical protein